VGNTLHVVGLDKPSYAFLDVAITVDRVGPQAAIPQAYAGELCPQSDRVDYRSLRMSAAAWVTPSGSAGMFTGAAVGAGKSFRVSQIKPLCGSKAISGTG
jgi:hypothetical protein